MSTISIINLLPDNIYVKMSQSDNSSCDWIMTESYQVTEFTRNPGKYQFEVADSSHMSKGVYEIQFGQNIVVQDDFLVTYENSSEIIQARGFAFDQSYHETRGNNSTNSDKKKIVPSYLEPGNCSEGIKIINKTKYPVFIQISEGAGNYNVKSVKLEPGASNVWNIYEIKHLAWSMKEEITSHYNYLVLPGKIYQICHDMHVREGNGEKVENCYCFSFDSPLEFGAGHFHTYEEIIQEDFYEKHLKNFKRWD